jgi:hypothetical protein
LQASLFSLAKTMAEEGSPILDIVGDEPEVPRLEESVTGSLSKGSSGGGSNDNADAEADDAGAMDPLESTRSYDFGASTIIVGRLRQLESLGYFAEGSTHEPREETSRAG